MYLYNLDEHMLTFVERPSFCIWLAFLIHLPNSKALCAENRTRSQEMVMYLYHLDSNMFIYKHIAKTVFLNLACLSYAHAQSTSFLT